MDGKILLAHGSGGKLSHGLVRQYVVNVLSNEILEGMDDAATIQVSGRIAFTTDSYVVNPPCFPGGDIGKLAVCGTINDLSMVGARPQHLSLSLIIEEGFPLEDLERIIASVKETADEAQVTVITGDTKVVNRGAVDKIFINTAGIGTIPDGVFISGSRVQVGDKVILSGPIGDHGIAVMTQREGLTFQTALKSDVAPLNGLVAAIVAFSPAIHCMRDPTRGGLASTLNEIAQQSHVGIHLVEDRIPVNEPVRSACELLGFDPLYVANEGKLVAFVGAEDAENVLAVMRTHTYGSGAEIIGDVVSDSPGTVVMKTRLGTSRIVDMITGELLPRIC